MLPFYDNQGGIDRNYVEVRRGSSDGDFIVRGSNGYARNGELGVTKDGDGHKVNRHQLLLKGPKDFSFLFKGTISMGSYRWERL